MFTKIINLFKKYEKLKSAILLIIVGLIIAIISGFVILKPNDNFKKVNATITSIELESVDEDEFENYNVAVKYEVDGKEYESNLGAYDSSWKVGDVIECEYNINNPTEIQSAAGMIPIIFCLIGITSTIIGIILLIKRIKTPASELFQYDRVDKNRIDSHLQEKIKNNNEPLEEFVFHFTGKLNQSYIMEDKNGKPVFEAICDGIKLVKDTKYTFINHLTDRSVVKMIGHTLTESYGNENFSNTISSSFKIDGENCWDEIAKMGYGFKFKLNGMKAHFDVEHMGVNIGFAEVAGVNEINGSKKGKLLGNIPTNGIYKVKCSKSDLEALFLICFCLSKTELTLS